MLGAASLSACTSWQVQPVAPEPLVTNEHPSAVRVTLLDGNQVVLNGPRISGDSMLGTTKAGSTGVRLVDIKELAVQHGDALKTTGMILGLAAIPFVVFGVALAIECNNGTGC